MVFRKFATNTQHSNSTFLIDLDNYNQYLLCNSESKCILLLIINISNGILNGGILGVCFHVAFLHRELFFLT